MSLPRSSTARVPSCPPGCSDPHPISLFLPHSPPLLHWGLCPSPEALSVGLLLCREKKGPIVLPACCDTAAPKDFQKCSAYQTPVGGRVFCGAAVRSLSPIPQTRGSSCDLTSTLPATKQPPSSWEGRTKTLRAEHKEGFGKAKRKRKEGEGRRM